jgi:Amt family ammonium transporter
MSFDLDAFCTGLTAASSSSEQAVCALQTIVAGVSKTVGGIDAEGITAGVDTFFLIFAGALVFMMQAGFAMLCAGSVRQKNVKNIMLKNLLDACGGAIGFYTVGFGFAYGGDDTTDKTFIGNSYFALRDYTNYAGFFFQFAFAATAATIVAGTVAERCKMSAYLCYSLFLTGFVYPVVVRSVWSSNGFLSAFSEDPFQGVGTVDFAGSGVVHMTGGLTALIAAIVLGPRKGRFYDEDGNPLETPASFPAHSVALQILGTFILWFGWYGFNPGSALAIANADSAATAALCAVTTTMAAAAGCVSAMFTDSIIDGMATGETTYDLTMAMNGCLAGLVAVTAGTSVVTPWAAIIIGVIGGWVYIGMSKLLIKLKIDDAVDAIPVHFANGFWGVLATGLFANGGLMATAGYNSEHEGWFYEWGSGSGDGSLLICQLACLAWIIGWVTTIMTPFFILLNMAGMFRVDPLEEEVGLDISHHRGSAYDLSGPSKDHVDELMEIRASKHGKVEVPKEVAQAADDAAEETA